MNIPGMPTLCVAVLRFQEFQGQKVSVNENTWCATTAAIAEQKLNALGRLDEVSHAEYTKHCPAWLSVAAAVCGKLVQ